ncbi:maleylpyruvate isomerase family mycothiol-dependent enzyme [Pseudonocardia humida]|uniref:Maleylpyruvate isomerase family mycothiol-dependent enzyme n=1 Tax=Pseudonocardia humida TaxID=2800819 RepID=A0ABT0ZWK3_9PSEU|nr:maleylpyruvate isomerase family mycothiol-dependent enzyme [Pseudonocardia humida]MCO1655101.1 maleylpyruvate isomerase family mycothiol-dependent enzyme [Pseudonocardia humida]
MSDDDVRAAVIAERRDQVEVLTALTPGQWDAPTLCEGWRVREVVAHTTSAYRLSFGRFLLDLLAARGSINRAADRRARADAAVMGPSELLACLRDNVEHPWTPPGGGPAGALSHDVIHGLDITVALGLDRTVPPERLSIVLGGLKPKNIGFFGIDLSGVQLRATDREWTFGEGEPVHGTAADLLLVVCGRRLPPGRLTGARADRYTRA